MDYQQLAERLFPQIQLTPDDIEARYPARQLPEGAKVTRIAPSPTGFMHMEIFMGQLSTNGWRTRAAASFICALKIPTKSD